VQPQLQTTQLIKCSFQITAHHAIALHGFTGVCIPQQWRHELLSLEFQLLDKLLMATDRYDWLEKRFKGLVLMFKNEPMARFQ